MLKDKLSKADWDSIVNADEGAKTTSISLTGEHTVFVSLMDYGFLKDRVRAMLTKELETDSRYLEAMERKIEKDLKAIQNKQK